MKTWCFIFTYDHYGSEAEHHFSVEADTFNDASVLADAYVKGKLVMTELSTIRLDRLGTLEKNWGKSKSELQEPCDICNPAFVNPLIDDDGLYLFIDKDRLMTGYSDECTFEITESLKINYCPMCGRKLEEAANE